MTINTIERAKRALLGSPFTGAGFLEAYMGSQQRMALHHSLNGEERAGIAEQLVKVIEQIQAAPLTYAQSEAEEPVVHLHYFRGGSDWWITELDREDRVSQAFGFVCLNGDRDMAELGYISITELVRNGVELDLHWTPKPLSECLK